MDLVFRNVNRIFLIDYLEIVSSVLGHIRQSFRTYCIKILKQRSWSNWGMNCLYIHHIIPIVLWTFLLHFCLYFANRLLLFFSLISLVFLLIYMTISRHEAKRTPLRNVNLDKYLCQVFRFFTTSLSRSYLLWEII